MTKYWEKILFKYLSFSSKIAIYSSKDVQATRKDFSPQKRTSSSSKNEILNFSIFMGHFFPPRSGSDYPIKSGFTTLVDPDPRDQLSKSQTVSGRLNCTTCFKKCPISNSHLVGACKQCSRSVTFWYGSGCVSGSSHPYLWLTDQDAHPGGPKLYGSYGSRCVSGTLPESMQNQKP